MSKSIDNELIIDLIIGFERANGPRLFNFFFGPIVRQQNINVLTSDNKRYLASIYTYEAEEMLISLLVSYNYDQDTSEKCYYTVSLHPNLLNRDNIVSIIDKIHIFKPIEIKIDDNISRNLLGNKLMQGFQNARALLEQIKDY